MSQLINISDEAYERLTKLKKIKNESYTEIILELLGKATAKKYSLSDILTEIKNEEKTFSGKKDAIDHDLVAYGVSR